MQLPHQLLQQRITQFYDAEIRARYFRGLDFAGPQGDPGWFGPGSAVWHVHSHTPALIFGLQCASYLERLDPSIFWMGIHHSRLVDEGSDGVEHLKVDLEGAAVRLGHSVSFFIATAYGSTADAERVTKTVRAMHHTIKGDRPDGLRYDADDPDWLRWNYATVVWGIATAHEYYHPNPLRGKEIDRYYREFVKVGQALGGTDLPETKADTLDCLKSYLPKLALTYGAAMATNSNLGASKQPGPPGGDFLDWAIRDTMPSWAAAMVMHRSPNPIERALRQASVWSVINGIHLAMGPLPEFEQARKRARSQAGAKPTSPTYVLGSDPVRSRARAEQMA